jgi:quinol monooxygenase YgiN
MIILTIHVKIHSNKRREFLQTVLALTKELQKKPGCLSYHTSQDIENENIFYFVTKWQTQNELETYFRTRNFNVLLGALHILSETSEMMINEVTLDRDGNRTGITQKEGTYNICSLCVYSFPK